VSRLTTLLRSFGTDGAVANVRSVLEDRRREDWVVQGLVHRLDPAPIPAALPAATSTRVA
jgi:hypothetical protein